MCVILFLPPHTLPSDTELFNAIHNNEDGYGIVIQKFGQPLDIRKGMFMKPEEMMAILRENIEHNRYVHVRNNTAGENSVENLHPFSVLKTPEREVLFMHNGTLQDYKPKSIGGSFRWEGTTKIEIPGTPSPDAHLSDTACYVRDFLTPLVSNWSDPKHGRGWINHPMLLKVIEKNWDYQSKGLLIATDCEPVFVKQTLWVEKGTDRKWFASNNTYFGNLTRGTLFQRIKAEEDARKKREEEERKASEAKRTVIALPDRTVVPLKEVGFNQGFSKRILDSAADIFTSIDIWDDRGLADIALLSQEELDEINERHPVEFMAVMGHMAYRFREVFEDLVKTMDKHHRATQNCETLAKELESMKSKKEEKVG